jgi:hypothetical protein
MPVAGGGFEQCYNAQAVVAADSLLVIAAQVVQAPNHKQQIEPMLKRIEALPAVLGKPDTLLADTGYFSDCGNNNSSGPTVDWSRRAGPLNPASKRGTSRHARRHAHRCRRRYDTASLAALTGRALMIFRAGFALKYRRFLCEGIDAFPPLCGGFLDDNEFSESGDEESPAFLSSL